MQDYAKQGTSYGPETGARPAPFHDKAEATMRIPHKEPELKQIVDRLDQINGNLEKTIILIEEKMMQLHNFEQKEEYRGEAKSIQEEPGLSQSAISIIRQKLNSLNLKSRRVENIYNQLCEIL